MRQVKGRRTAPLCQQHARPTLCTRRASDIVEMVVPRTPLPKPDDGGRDGLPPKACGTNPQYLRDRGAKCIWSLYLPWMTGVTPELSTTTPPKGPASTLHYQCRDHAMARRLCRGDLPAPAHSSRLACPGTGHGEAAPTAFLLTDSIACREGRPYPQSQQVDTY